MQACYKTALTFHLPLPLPLPVCYLFMFDIQFQKVPYKSITRIENKMEFKIFLINAFRLLSSQTVV